MSFSYICFARCSNTYTFNEIANKSVTVGICGLSAPASEAPRLGMVVTVTNRIEYDELEKMPAYDLYKLTRQHLEENTLLLHHLLP